MRAPFYESDEYFALAIANGLKNGFIQNEDNIPIIYNIFKRANNKVVTSKILTAENKFDTYISFRDKTETTLTKQNCWWLLNDNEN